MPAPTLKPSAKSSLDAILNSVTSTSKKQYVPGIGFGAINADGEIIYEGYSGSSSVGGDSKVSSSTIFPIWSCTKFITATCILHFFSLNSPGQMAPTDILDDPSLIDKHLPEFAHLQLVELNEKGQLEFQNANTKKSITMKMLLNHTAGFGYSFFKPELREYRVIEKGNKSWNESDEFSGSIKGIQGPLVSKPGEKYVYGTGFDWAGVLLERISGVKLGTYAKTHIFEPLGLSDCDFDLRSDMEDRLIGMSYRNKEGQIAPADHLPFVTASPTKFHSGGSGLLSNASSYLTALTIILNNGVGRHRETKEPIKILEPEWAKLLSSNSLTAEQALSLQEDIKNARPELVNPIPGPNRMGIPAGHQGLGFGGLISDVPLPTGRREGTVTWFGLGNLIWQADPKTGIASFLLSQILPGGDLSVFGANAQLETTLYQNLIF